MSVRLSVFTLIPVLALVAGSLGVACGAEEADSNSSTTGTEVTLAVVSPTDSSTVSQQELVIKGSSTGATEIKRDKTGFDEKIKPASDGSWEFKTKLEEGRKQVRVLRSRPRQGESDHHPSLRPERGSGR